METAVLTILNTIMVDSHFEIRSQTSAYVFRVTCLALPCDPFELFDICRIRKQQTCSGAGFEAHSFPLPLNNLLGAGNPANKSSVNARGGVQGASQGLKQRFGFVMVVDAAEYFGVEVDLGFSRKGDQEMAD